MTSWVSPAGRVGNLLGEGKSRRAGISANTSLVLALAMAGVFRFISFVVITSPYLTVDVTVQPSWHSDIPGPTCLTTIPVSFSLLTFIHV